MSIFYQKRLEDLRFYISHNNSYPAHLHKEVEFVYVLSGEISITIDESTYQLHPGDCSIAFPNSIHRSQTIKQSDILLCIFSLDFINDFINEFTNFRPEPPILLADQVSFDAQNALSRLKTLSPTKHDPRLFKGYLTITITEILAKMNLKPFASNTEMNLSQQLLTYIDAHYTETLSLEHVAKALGISKFYLSHIFSDKLHTSYTAYLSCKRIELSKNLLTSTSLPITEIAYESGFSSTRTFFRAFEKFCHLTPKEYRSKHALPSLKPSEELQKESPNPPATESDSLSDVLEELP